MKKILVIAAIIVGVVLSFGIISKRAEANQAIFGTGSQDERDLAKQISLGILRDTASRRPIGNVDEFEVKKVDIDDLQMAHTRVQQKVNGVPVWEGEAIIHLKGDGTLSSITDNLIDGIAIDTNPSIGEKQAFRSTLNSYSGGAKQTDEPIIEMYIYRGKERDHLVYRIETPRLDGTDATSAPVDFIDAHTG
ncbi:MAG: hypothetical protein ABL959_01795, partial [Pyrinomonadaceae bacterium]